MHPDRKIGIAMGILLVGVVAALFFRNEPLIVDDGLSLRRENELNQRLQDRDVTIFVNNQVTEELPNADDQPDWSLSDMLNDLTSKEDASPLPIGSTASLKARQPKESTTTGGSASITSATGVAGTSVSDFPATESAVANADSSIAQQPAATEFTEYTVKFGDTLSEISERFLGSQGRYREIYDANKDRMASPDHLKVGKAIRIPRVIR